MASNVTWDASDFLRRAETAISKAQDIAETGIRSVADEVLRLSQYEVPHDTGLLQNSGHVESAGKNEQIVGYNKVYAARLHEHPEYHFQGGRKGKYLEDPIKRNLTVFKRFIEDAMRGVF